MCYAPLRPMHGNWILKEFFCRASVGRSCELRVGRKEKVWVRRRVAQRKRSRRKRDTRTTSVVLGESVLNLLLRNGDSFFLLKYFVDCCSFYGENLQAQAAHLPPKKKRKRENDVTISTIYDDPAELDPPERLMRRNEPYHLKHRHVLPPFQAFQRPSDPDLQVLK